MARPCSDDLRRRIVRAVEDGASVREGAEAHEVAPSTVTNGVLAGGTRAYQFRADLRAVYQYYCRNHPAPDETQYPLWQGLPAGSSLTRAELRERVRACTGAGARSRTSAQRRNLHDILGVTGLREDELNSHLEWATFTFRDLVGRLDGRNPFENSTRRYEGSRDDEALNAGVERFSADPEAVSMLRNDSDLTGHISVPTLTIHAKNDPTACVSQETAYRETVAAAGRADLLVQTFTDEDNHSHLSPAEVVAGLTCTHAMDRRQRPPNATDGGRIMREDGRALPRRLSLRSRLHAARIPLRTNGRFGRPGLFDSAEI